MKDNRLKRFLREHRSKPRGPWVFHRVQWGDLEVSVMPRSIDGGSVVDSNTGVVLKAPYHGLLRSCVVVNDGSRPNCDEAALNWTLTSDRNKCWMDLPGVHPYCLPQRRGVPEAEKNEAYRMAVEAIMSQGLTKEQAEFRADMVLGWCPDSLSCGGCELLIPGIGTKEVVDQAREYGWKVIFPLAAGSWRCPVCANARSEPIPDPEALAAMFPEDYR